MFEKLSSLAGDLSGHVHQWDAWAVVVAGTIYGWRRGPLWAPLVVALVINPVPYGIVAAMLHGRHPNGAAAGLFTALQIVLAFLGFGFGRVIARLR